MIIEYMYICMYIRQIARQIDGYVIENGQEGSNINVGSEEQFAWQYPVLQYNMIVIILLNNKGTIGDDPGLNKE